MAAFLDILATFPTVLFAFAFVMAILYWLLVIVGAADLELLDGLDGAFEGIDGALDAADGAFDAAAEAVDAAAEAASEAVSEGLTEGVSEAAEGLEGASVGFGPLLFIANLFRLGRIPLTISLTFFAIGGFAISFFLTWLALRFPEAVPSGVVMAGTFVLATAGAIATTNVASRPFEPMFQLHRARERKSLIGEICELSTGRTDGRFGQAHTQIDGDDLLFQVRCDSPNTMQRGDRALIVSFDNRREAYVIEPLHDEAAADARRLPSPQAQKEG